MVHEEQRKYEDLQLTYETEMRKYQRELNLIKDEHQDRETQLNQVQKTNERQTKEIELKDQQLEALRAQTHKDASELRELKTLLEEAQLDAERMRKERERRQETELDASKTKEQLQKEKYDLMNELSALQHKFDVFKTLKQTEAHKSDEAVRDAQTRVDILEKSLKKQIYQNETLQRDFT